MIFCWFAPLFHRQHRNLVINSSRLVITFCLGSIFPAFPLFFNKTTFLVDCTKIDSPLSHQRDDNDDEEEKEFWSCYKFCNEIDRVLCQLPGLRFYIENGSARGTWLKMIFSLLGLWKIRWFYCSLFKLKTRVNLYEFPAMMKQPHSKIMNTISMSLIMKVFS